jgi:hypothetical protein
MELVWRVFAKSIFSLTPQDHPHNFTTASFSFSVFQFFSDQWPKRIAPQERRSRSITMVREDAYFFLTNRLQPQISMV